MEVKNIIRVPVKNYVCEYLINFYPTKNNFPFIELISKDFFKRAIINFIKAEAKNDENFIPKSHETFVYLQTSGQLGIVGLNEEKAKRLGGLINAYVLKNLFVDVWFYSTLPGISISEAIITVIGKYDLSSLRSDSLRRSFDRYRNENTTKIIDVFTINKRVNGILKNLYDEKFTKYLKEQ